MKKQKPTRSKWTYERAKQLEEQRQAEGLSWKLLGKQEKMSAAAVKHSMKKWLKRSPEVSVYEISKDRIAPIEQPGDNKQKDIKSFMADRIEYHWRMYHAWKECSADQLGL